MPPEEQTRVTCPSLGEGRGVYIPVTRRMCEEIGIDPDQPVEANRNAFGDADRPTIRARLYNIKEDG